MGLNIFKKPKVPGLDTGALLRKSEESKARKTQLAGEQFAAMQPGMQQFEQKRQALSAQLEPGAETHLGRLSADISGINKMEEDQANVAGQLNRQQAFRNVPEVQKMIRNQLSGNRLMGSGAALSTLAQPTIQAAQSASDFDMQRQADLLENKTKRAEGLATTGFSTRQQAMADRIGMDQGTIDMLTQMGRTDLINKFNTLVGAEESYGQEQQDIEMARQMNDIAQAKAKAANRGALLGNLGSLAGLGLGSLAGPMGAAVGMQLGGMAGGMLGGQETQQLDPTLLFALAQRNKKAYSASNPTESKFAANYNTGGY